MADPKLMRKTVLTAKKETTKGTDATPTAALNAMRAMVSDPKPLNAEFKDRDPVGQTFGSSGKVAVSAYSKVSFRVEFATAGAAGTSPAWYPLLEMCGFAVPTIVSLTSVTANLITTGIPTGTIYWYLDGLRHRMLGCMGNMKISLPAKDIPYLDFDMLGLYTAPTDTPLPSDTDYSAFTLPLAVNKVNTPSWSIHGVSGLGYTDLSIDLGNQVVYRNMPGREEIVITDRNVKGNITFDSTSVTTKAWIEAARLGDAAAFSLTHGTAAGKIITLTAPKVSLSDHSYSNVEGMAMNSFGLDFQKDVANDELVIALT